MAHDKKQSNNLNFEKTYKNQLKELRENLNLLENYSIDLSNDNNYNQIQRNKILIALYNDLKPKDYPIVDFIFNEEKKLKQSNLQPEVYEVETLYLAAYLLTTFKNIDDIWKFLDSKLTDFDSSIGFDTEYLLSFGVNKVLNYLKTSDNPNKKKLLSIITNEQCKSIYTQIEIDEWIKYKREYFSVYEFPIKDEIDFAFQAKEYELLKQLLPNWLLKKNDWTEYQNLTCIGIGKELKLDDFLLDSLINYNIKFPDSVRIEMHKVEILTLCEKLNREVPIEIVKPKKNFFNRIINWNLKK